jgi:hypothetical protein
MNLQTLTLISYDMYVIAAEDLEAGTRNMRFQAEPTLPIYLKVTTIVLGC